MGLGLGLGLGLGGRVRLGRVRAHVEERRGGGGAKGGGEGLQVIAGGLEPLEARLCRHGARARAQRRLRRSASQGLRPPERRTTKGTRASARRPHA